MSDFHKDGSLRQRKRYTVEVEDGTRAAFTYVGEGEPDEELLEAMRNVVRAAIRHHEDETRGTEPEDER